MSARRLHLAALRHAVLVLLIGWAALAFVIAVLSGVSAQAGWDVLLATLLLGLIAAVLRARVRHHGGVARLGRSRRWLAPDPGRTHVPGAVGDPGHPLRGFWDAFGPHGSTRSW